MDKLKLDLQYQCGKVVDYLEKNYANQLNFNGPLKSIYNKFLIAIEKIQFNESIKSITFNGCVRMFVDDTTDYESSVIKDIEKSEQMLKELQGK